MWLDFLLSTRHVGLYPGVWLLRAISGDHVGHWISMARGALFDGFDIQSDSSDDESDHEESNEIMELVGHMLTRDIHDTTVTPHILALREARQAQVATLSIVERCVIFTQLVRVVQAVMWLWSLW